MQYPNSNLPNILNITPTFLPDSAQVTPETLETAEQVRIKEIALTIIAEIATTATIEQSIKLANALITTEGKGAACILATHFNELGLKPAGKEEQEQYFNLIARITREGGDDAAQSLFSRLSQESIKSLTPYLLKSNYINEAPIEQRLTLYAEIAKQGDDAASELFSLHADDTRENLQGTTPQQRLALYTLIAKQGIDAATALVNQLDLTGVTAEESLELYKQIARQGVIPSAQLAANFDTLVLLPDQILALSKEILNQGEEAAAILAEYFYKVKIADKDLFTFLSYAVSKGLQKTFAESRSFFEALPNAIAKRQVLIDLLSPPSGLRGTVDLSQYNDPNEPSSQSFMAPIAQLLPILNKEPGLLNEADIQQLKTFISTHPRLKILESLIANIEEETKNTIEKNLEKDSQKAVKKGEHKIKEEGAFVRAGLMAWIAYAAAVISPMTPEQIASIADSKVLDLILPYAHPSLRYSFTRTFSQMSSIELAAFAKELTSSPKESSPLQEQAAEEGDKAATDKVIEPFTQLQRATFWLSPLTNFGLSPNKRTALRNQIKSTRSMKQLSVSSALAQLLSIITSHGPYTTEEADKIADCIIKALKQPEIAVKTKKKVKVAVKEGEKTVKQEPQMVLNKEEQTKKDLGALTSILQIFGKEEMVRFVTPANKNVSAASFFQNRFKTIFAVEGFEDTTVEKQYQKTFGQFRDPMALFSYYRATDRLPNDEKVAVQATLNAFVNSVLREDFKDVRYKPENSAHLTQVFSARPELEKLWRTSLEPKSVASTQADEVDVKENEAQLTSRYQVMEIDDPCDLLLIGTEIKGSCQSVFADPKKNQALTSYLMNGEIKAIAIKQGGKLVGRVLLRLMWDDVNKCPVLLQEPLYSNVDSPAFAEAINKFTKEKAKAMGVPLLSQEIVTENPYNETVQFLGGFAPVGYSDSADTGLITHPNISTITLPESAMKKEEYDQKETGEGIKLFRAPPANAPFSVSDTYMLYKNE